MSAPTIIHLVSPRPRLTDNPQRHSHKKPLGTPPHGARKLLASQAQAARSSGQPCCCPFLQRAVLTQDRCHKVREDTPPGPSSAACSACHRPQPPPAALPAAPPLIGHCAQALSCEGSESCAGSELSLDEERVPHPYEGAGVVVEELEDV